MLEPLRKAAVRWVKPRINPETWARIKLLDPSSKRRALPSTETLPPLREWDLASLARHFGSDKWGVHRYAPRYEHHFGKLKNDKFTLLEIGIGGYRHPKEGGASLKMWKEFFPNATILGLDIVDKSFLNKPRIRTYRGSQTSEPLLRTIADSAENLQIVVDDGSHRPAHVRTTFDVLFPLLAPGGMYAIEDTQTSYWPPWGGSLDLNDASTTMGLVKRLIDGLNYEEWQDDGYEPTYTDMNVVAVHCYHNLVIIVKGSNQEGTNRPQRWRG